MNYPTRVYFTDADKSLMCDRWRKGESLTWQRGSNENTNDLERRQIIEHRPVTLIRVT